MPKLLKMLNDLAARRRDSDFCFFQILKDVEARRIEFRNSNDCNDLATRRIDVHYFKDFNGFKSPPD